MLQKDVGEYLNVFAKMFVEWSPYELHFLLMNSVLPILEIQPCKEQSFKAHICKQSCISVRMPECIYRPTYPRLNPKLSE